MTTIHSLLARDLRHKIEEVIQVEQADEQSVYAEITEYIATERLQDEYARLLKAIAEAPADPNEGIGVWISGFFGSGKSSFAKNIGYALANHSVLGHHASDLLKVQLSDDRISALIDSINSRFPTEVIMFDVSVNRAVRRGNERIAEIMYTMLLNQLGYAEDYDIAELEIELEAEGRLDEFIERCGLMYEKEWSVVRKGAQKIARASVLLHDLYPKHYLTQDSWALSLRDKSADITVGKFVERAFDLTSRRYPEHALVFIIDEVGQYVARSGEKIEDLRAVVEQFGKESKNRIRQQRIIGPTWVMVTSQEKLDEVVASIDNRRVELAKLQDRFRHRIDLAPADIREVATRRVLAKRDTAVPIMRDLFRKSQGQLNSACRLEQTTRRSEVTEDEFIQFYPYLPHFIDLSIDIMSGIRLQPGAPRHYGGSNRTIIKQTYEMLVSDRTRMADAPVGTLVTLDKIFELVEGTLSTEKQKDISDIHSRFEHDDDADMIVQVAKTIALLEFVRDLPRTEHNIAACLIKSVGQPAQIEAVERALTKLEAAQFVRTTDEGWKLQTAQEKNWEQERQGYKDPKPRERNDILRATLGEIFSEPQLKTYRYRSLPRPFRVGIAVENMRVGDEGQIPLNILVADEDTFAARLEEARAESRQNVQMVYWAFSLTTDIDELVANFHASTQMVTKYGQMAAQGHISNEDGASLGDERTRMGHYRVRLRDKVLEAVEGGTGLFKGVSRDGSALGKNANEVFRNLFDMAMPDLYPKLEMGVRPTKGGEIDEILKAANLNGLSQVFYSSDAGFGFVIREGAKYVINPQAPTTQEVLNFLNREHEYGNRETRTGKHLETEFGGLGYGWEPEAIRLMLTVLFRAGLIDVSSEGQRFDSYTDAHSREVFGNLPKFRKAVFTPTRPIDLKTLTRAVENFELLVGETIDVEPNAIAGAFRQFSSDEIQRTAPMDYQVRQHQLPVASVLEQYRQTLTAGTQTVEASVNTLAGDGATLRELRDRIERIREAISDQGLAAIQFARHALNDMVPLLETRGYDGELSQASAELEALLESETFYDSLADIGQLTQQIAAPYYELYNRLHNERAAAYSTAVEEIKGLAAWANVPEDQRSILLERLTSRACPKPDGELGDLVCSNCNATLPQLESDLDALQGIKAQVNMRVQEITTPQKTIKRVRLSEVFAEPIETEETVETAVESLREYLLKLVAQGIKIVLD